MFVRFFFYYYLYTPNTKKHEIKWIFAILINYYTASASTRISYHREVCPLRVFRVNVFDITNSQHYNTYVVPTHSYNLISEIIIEPSNIEFHGFAV